MMKQQIQRKHIYMAIGLVLCMLLTLDWAYSSLVDNRDAAHAAKLDLDQCYKLADDIRTFSGNQSHALDRKIQDHELKLRVEQSAKQSGITSVRFIDPQTPVTLKGMPYKRQSTLVKLEQVTLPSLIAFLQKMASDETGLEITQLHLTVPRGQEIGDRWIAQVTLTYLIYAPQASPPRKTSLSYMFDTAGDIPC